MTISLEGTVASKLKGSGSRNGLTWEVTEGDGNLVGYDEGTGDLEGLLNLLVDVLEGKVL